MNGLNRYFDFLFGVPLSYFLSLFKTRQSNTPVHPKRVLIIKLAAMGDTILLLPVLKRFREKHPGAVIHWLVTPINVSLASRVTYIDKTILWDRKIGWSLIKLIMTLRNQKYDVVVDLEQWSRGSAIISYLTGSPIRLGFDTPGQFRSVLFSQTYTKKFDQHEIYDFFALLSLIGPLEPEVELELPFNPSGDFEIAQVPQIFKTENKKQIRVLVHPGCGADGRPREWPLVSYAVLLNWLINKYGTQVILTSGPEEINKTADLSHLLNGKAVDLGGRLTWAGLMALVNTSDLVISGNTGIMHVAAALGKKQIALHGPTNAKIWGPLNKNAKIILSPCPRCPCLKLGFEYHSLDQSCMSQISVDTVKNAASSLIDNP